MFKSFKFLLNPTKEQAMCLNKHFGCSRFVFNWGLAKKIEQYKLNGKTISAFELMKRLVEMKSNEDFSWLKDVQAQTLQASLVNLDKAFTSFFKKKTNFPKYKKKSNSQSYQYPQNVKIVGDKIYLPKIGLVDFCKSREVVGKIKTTTISLTSSGRYYVSILCDTGGVIPKKVKIKNSIGIDLGIKSFAVTSDGSVFENQKHLPNALKKLRVEQRSLARKQKGSKRREKQRLRVAKLYERVCFQRTDYLHKVSTELVRKYDAICIEDLNVSGMIRNKSLSKAISDLGWGQFRSFLTYKCSWYGKTLIVIGRFEPSSKMCGHCGNINRELKLSDRVWTCQNCDRTIDRDLNAAINVKKIGLGQRPSVVNVNQ